MTKIIRPKCPNCSKVQQEELEGKGSYTCPRCKLKFTINTEVLDKVVKEVVK